jgi:hypothetical protein
VSVVENKKGKELKPSNRSRSTLLVVVLAVLTITIGLAGCPSNLMAQPGGTFTVTGNLTTARTQHTATLLKNGKVLIAGGYLNGLPLASAELYDPSTRTFTATGNMITPRESHLATPLNDGRVLIVGGYSPPGGGIADAELYDPSSAAFHSTGRMTTPRQDLSATLLKDGNVLIAGGLEYDASSDSYNILASAELYDPVTETFTPVGNMSTERGQHTATLLRDGRVLIAGGIALDGASAEIYDPSTRTFTESRSMTSARAGHTATLLQDGTVLIVGPGGRNVVYTSGPPAETYDPSTGTFATAGEISRVCCVPPTATLLLDGRVLFAGGAKEICLRFQLNFCTAVTSSVTASADLYDPTARTFSSTGSMNVPRAWSTATLLRDGTVLVTGGTQGKGDSLAGAEIYMPDPPPFLRAKAFPLSTRDFDGDARADILWRDAAGNVSVGLMNGSTITKEKLIGNVWTGWTIVGSGDFNGDGLADILWRDSAGNVAIWLMNGTTVMSYSTVANVPMAWSIAGVGDFDGDRKSDILWHDISGNVAIWLMNGTTVSSYSTVGNVWPDWSIVGVGDFNGDKKSDIVWRNSSGDVAVWVMNGFSVASFGDSGNMVPAAALAGVGDFNGDGKTDIVWRDSAGNATMWLMDGITIVSSTLIANVWTGWTIVGSGDFDGDGKSDFLWQDTTGNEVIWFMNGSSISSYREIEN